MDQLANELRRGLLLRADALASKVRDYRGQLGNTTLPIAGLLDIFAEFPNALKHVISQEWNHNTNANSRVEILRALHVHQSEVTTFVDTWLHRDTESEVPLYLLGSIQRMCESMGIASAQPIVVVGPANNYITLTADIRSLLFDKLGDFCPPLPDNLSSTNYVVIRAPHLEGTNILWAPILLGHELAHLAVIKNSALAHLGLETLFDYSRAKAVVVPGVHSQGTDQAAMTLYDIAARWATELMCDAYAVRSFCLGGVAAMAEYLDVIGATDKISETHPPGRLRVQLMLEWLPEQDEQLKKIVAPWQETGGRSPQMIYPDWAHYLCELFEQNSQKLMDEAMRWIGSSYSTNGRSEIILELASDLANGVPGDLTYSRNGTIFQVEEADVIASAWMARVEGHETPFTRLAQKGLESREFVRCWKEAGGDWGQVESSPALSSSAEGLVLSSEQIQARLGATGSQRLIVRPHMAGIAEGVSLDIRLANQFIVFVRSRTTSFDPVRVDQHPQSMQRFIELRWGEQFVLHPNELVLAATLEYLVIPSDLTAQVVTRSSYGRLGLLSATAVQVQPNFHGCLTLELVNLGTVPLELTPGERIAQLVFIQTSETARGDSKYHCTVGPQFSRVHADNETEILRGLVRKR